MASTAISAQGSTLSIGSTAGSAKTVSGIAVGFPTIVTATAHGFSNGDVVTFSGVTGTDAALMNALSFVVKNVTTNTFAIDLNSVGKTLTGTGTATPITWTQIINVKSFSGFDGQAADIDVTNLDSTAKEWRLGLIDQGGFSFELDYDNTATSHAALRTKQTSSALTPFKLTLPNTNVVSFSAYVKRFQLQGGVDQVVKASVDLKISGAVTGL